MDVLNPATEMANQLSQDCFFYFCFELEQISSQHDIIQAVSLYSGGLN
jgi:hypothetical protein